MSEDQHDGEKPNLTERIWVGIFEALSIGEIEALSELRKTGDLRPFVGAITGLAGLIERRVRELQPPEPVPERGPEPGQQLSPLDEGLARTLGRPN